MNLAEALNAAAPEIVRPRRDRFFKLDPALVAREQYENGEPMIMVFNRGNGNLYRFMPQIWEVLQHFDGSTSYDDIAEAIAPTFPLSAADLKTYAEGLAESDFWFKSPQEKNEALHHQHQEERRAHVQKKSKYGDVSHMQFSAWDPDVFLTRWYNAIRFVFTRWFTMLTLAMFAIMAVIFVANWCEIGRDTLQYYTFTEKSFSDIVEFWLLFFFMGFFHESAHGLTCKHFGGEVHSMGFHLIYLTPAFFIDVSEVYVYGGKWQRLASLLSGIWVEMMFCSAATLVWWGTPPGIFAHEFAYKMMLITGVAVIVVNANPLIKLDGYFMFCELFGTPEIKDRSTAFISTWVRNKIFRLPVDIEYIQGKRQWLYIGYGVLSGAYSYMLLFTVSRFAYNVFTSYAPEWGVLPGVGVFLLIFRSRIKNLLRFMKIVSLDKREWLRSRLATRKAAFIAAVILLAALIPIWPDRIEARCSIKPAARAIVRAEVPGFVREMKVQEGDRVETGQVLAVLHNPEVESVAARARVEMITAQADYSRAQLSYASLGSTMARRDEMEKRERLARAERERLVLKAPIAGVVTTRNPQDEVGAYREAGETVVDVAGSGGSIAEAYVPESDLRNLRVGQTAALYVDELNRVKSGKVVRLSAEATQLASGLMHVQDYKGLEPPKYYVADIELDSAVVVRDQATATAKINVGHISAATILRRGVRDFLGRKLW
jgi:putative peptide zinc metalloprotease protein